METKKQRLEKLGRIGKGMHKAGYGPGQDPGQTEAKLSTKALALWHQVLKQAMWHTYILIAPLQRIMKMTPNSFLAALLTSVLPFDHMESQYFPCFSNTKADVCTHTVLYNISYSHLKMLD